MTQQSLTIEQFHAYLNKWCNETIKITKNELRDVDETILHLSHINYQTDTRRIDDYVPMHTLYLNGAGNVMTEGHMAILPAAVYEIPLSDDTNYLFDGEQFTIQTERGTYTMECVSAPYK